jgi:hypothetical protein
MKWPRIRKHLHTAWLLICTLLTWGAAANTGIGFSAFICGIPFLWLIFSQSRHLKKQHRMLFLGFALLPLVAAFVFPASSNRLHYADIGAEVIVPAGWGSLVYPNDSTKYLNSSEELSNNKRSSSFNEGYQITVFPTTV